MVDDQTEKKTLKFLSRHCTELDLYFKENFESNAENEMEWKIFQNLGGKKRGREE